MRVIDGRTHRLRLTEHALERCARAGSHDQRALWERKFDVVEEYTGRATREARPDEPERPSQHCGWNGPSQASPEEVFDAWTNPAVLKRWWAPQPTWTSPGCEIDLRVGGRYVLRMQDDVSRACIRRGRRVSRGGPPAPARVHLVLGGGGRAQPRRGEHRKRRIPRRRERYDGGARPFRAGHRGVPRRQRGRLGGRARQSRAPDLRTGARTADVSTRPGAPTWARSKTTAEVPDDGQLPDGIPRWRDGRDRRGARGADGRMGSLVRRARAARSSMPGNPFAGSASVSQQRERRRSASSRTERLLGDAGRQPRRRRPSSPRAALFLRAEAASTCMRPMP